MKFLVVTAFGGGRQGRQSGGEQQEQRRHRVPLNHLIRPTDGAARKIIRADSHNGVSVDRAMSHRQS